MRIQAPRGTEDVLPRQVTTWQQLENTFRALSHHYSYQEIRTPVFEDVQLFKRTAGETSDIVSKEMYEFQDKGGRDVALKPEGTAPAIRAVIEHNLCPVGTHARLYYVTPCYRYGRPAKGRLRELHQFGGEFLGSSSPEADAEVIEYASRYFDTIGLTREQISINSIGRDECRAKFGQVILDHISSYLKDADEETKAKIAKNPLGLLDTKDPAQREAIHGLPVILDYLEDDSKARFEKLQSLLTEADVPYRVAPEVVRGLDYYTETVFELETKHLPGLSVFGGGRYDNLVKQLGGSQTPCVGFGIGVERLILALEAAEVAFEAETPDLFIVRATESAGVACRRLARELRAAGLAVKTDVDGRSMKSQLGQADKSGAPFALIIGDDELEKRIVTVRNLKSSDQKEVALDMIQEYLCDPSL